MFQHAVQQVHFAVVRNGYDRRQVDADVAEYERRASEARSRIDEAEARLAEVTEQARALEAKIAALQTRAPRKQPAGAAPVTELADRLLETVSATGRELPTQILSQAEQDKARLERTTANVREGARFRAARIVGSAQRERDEADEMVAAARSQIDQYINEGQSMADERAQAVWDEASARLRQPLLEVEEARRQSRAMRRELKQLRDMRDECWARVARRPQSRPRGLVEGPQIA